MAFPGLHSYEEAHTLRETMLLHLHSSIGKTREELYGDVVADFGNCGVRRFYRNLAYLIRVGCVRRDNEGNWCPETGCLRPIYFRLPADLPGSFVPWCRVCFLLGGGKFPRQFCAEGYGVISPPLVTEPGMPAVAQMSSRRDRRPSARPRRRAA